MEQQESSVKAIFENVRVQMVPGGKLPSANNPDAGDKIKPQNDPEDMKWAQENKTLWDFEQMAIDIRQRFLSETCKIPPPQDPVKHFSQLPWRPPPKKRMHMNETEFYEYIPIWTDPEFEVERQTGPRYFHGSLINRLYPAQTDASLAKNPTAMALRYGIHPDRTDGRSRLSPQWSESRRYQLENGDWVDASDLRRFAQEHFYNSEAASSSGYTIDGYIHAQSQKTATTKEEQKTLEMWQLCQKHNEELKRDENYQRLIFDGFSTNDLLQQGLLDFRNDIDFDLSGPLHILLHQARWAPPMAYPSTVKQPRQYYAMKDMNGVLQTGEWTAHDPLVWDAIQPALQLVTRVLDSDLPIWIGLMNLYTRIQIDLDRDPAAARLRDQANKGMAYTCRNAWQEEGRPPSDKSFPELLELCASKFNTISWTAKVLIDRLRITIQSCNRFRNETIAQSYNSGIYAVTAPVINGNLACIEISFGAELIWPLLSAYLSRTEKLSCHFALATVIIHELGHAVDMVHKMSRVEAFGLTLTSAPVPAQRRLLVKALGRLYDENHYEPFFEDDPQAETGFAVENQIFGGLTGFIHRSSYDFQPSPLLFMMTQLQMTPWPSARPYPWEALRGEGARLSYPPVTMINSKTLLPPSVFSKLFRQSFWKTNFAKYGPEALKLNSDGIVKTMRHSPPVSSSHWYVYGHWRGRFLDRAINILNDAGYVTIGYYMQSRSRRHAAGIATRRLWHYEHQTWPGLGSDLDRVTKELREAAIRYLPIFEDVAMPAAEKQLAFINKQSPQNQTGHIDLSAFQAWVAHAEQCKPPAFNLFLSKLMQLKRLLSKRFQYAQTMLCTLATIQATDRRKINRKHLNQFSDYVIKAPATILSKLKTALVSMMGLYRLRIERLSQQLQNQPTDAALQVQLQEDVKQLEEHGKGFAQLEMMFAEHAARPARVAHFQRKWGPKQQFVALTGPDLSEENAMFYETAMSDIDRIKDKDVRRLVDEVFKIMDAAERSEAKPIPPQPWPPSLPRREPPPTGPSEGKSRKRSSDEGGFEGGPSKQTKTSNSLPHSKLRAVHPAIPGMVQVVDPRVGFPTYVPTSRSEDVEVMLQQAAQERLHAALEAQKFLDDAKDREKATRLVAQRNLTAKEQEVLSVLQDTESDWYVFRQRAEVIQAFDSVGEPQSRSEFEDVDMGP